MNFPLLLATLLISSLMPHWGCCWSGLAWKLSPGSCSIRSTRTWSSENTVGVNLSAQKRLLCSQLWTGRKKWQKLQFGDKTCEQLASVIPSPRSSRRGRDQCVKCWDITRSRVTAALPSTLERNRLVMKGWTFPWADNKPPGHVYGKLRCLAVVGGEFCRVLLRFFFCSLSVQNVELCLNLPWGVIGISRT